MADYLPKRKPGQAIPMTASAAITGGQLVRVSGSGTVAPTSAASADWLGVAAQDAASGAKS
jgi:predicted RecA/RadA family phage recombinase